MYYRIVILYLLFWVILFENAKAETLFIGLVISLLVLSLNKNLIFSKRNINFRRNTVSFICYVTILIKEILVSNFSVAKIVLSPQVIISPQIAIIKTKMKSDFHKMIFANSISLTPGTLTIAMDKDKITIHCLKDEFAKGITNSVFEKIILRVEETIYE